MPTAWEEQLSRNYFMFTTNTDETYVYFYSRRDDDRLCDLTLYRDGSEAEKIGVATELFPLEIGEAALLGIDTWHKDMFLLKIDKVTHIGPAPLELIPRF